MGFKLVCSKQVFVWQWLLVLFSCLMLSNSWAESALNKSADRLQQLPAWQKFYQYNDAGFLIANPQLELLQSRNAEQLFIPASTTKIVTALLALQHWGEAHRFKTEFYLFKENNHTSLLVKGFGDPFLVSEELKIIAEQLQQQLQQQGISQIDQIILDASYYQPGLIMPGTGESDNPYDAIPAAIAANFNTLYIENQNGQLLSAEPQTPLTATGLKLAQQIKTFTKKAGKLTQRVNLGRDSYRNQRYFAELLAKFLQQQNITVANQISWQARPEHSQLLYRHFNSRTLADMVKPMMKYSTNFIANQIALNLTTEISGKQANQQLVQKTYHQLLEQQFNWQGYFLEDGAGLSRNNRLSAIQLLDVLDKFRAWAHLLPEVEQRVYAKSGSLIGVSTLAGYIENQGDLAPFVIMLNEKGPYRFRNKLARELTQIY